MTTACSATRSWSKGKLEEAIPAYQTMLDLKPGFESFVRAAHVRWLKGERGRGAAN